MIRLSLIPRPAAGEPSAGPAARPFAGRAWIRLGLLALLAAGAVYLSLVSVNILFLGTDDVGYSQHTDTLLLAHWRPLPRRLALLSVPRDTLVALPKYGPLKINAVYAYGKALNGPAYGLAMTRASLENLLGLKIHYLAQIRYSDFIALVDAIGGVPIYVAKRMRCDDEVSGLHVDLAPGYQLLDGRRSLDYVRYRHDEEGDLGRIRRQQEFVKAFVAQLTGFSRLPRTGRAFLLFLRRVETDLTWPAALFLGLELKGVAGENWRRAILPGREAFVEGKSYWQTDPAEIREYIGALGRNPGAESAAVAAAGAKPAVTGAPEPETGAVVAGGSGLPAETTAPPAGAAPAPAAGAPARPRAAPQPPATPPPAAARPAAAVKLPGGPQPVVRVLNGCGAQGVCHQIADRLARRRIRIQAKDVTNAPAFNFAVTVIKTNPKNLPWARGIAKMLGLPEKRIQIVNGRAAYPTVTVVVGQDYAAWLK